MDRPSKKLRLDANSSLLEAIGKNNHDEVLVLIENGADINPETNDWTECPLLYAIHHGHIQIAETLVMNGAKVDIKDKNGETPIHWATRYNRKELIEILVNHGADIDIGNEDFDKDSPIHSAVFGNKKEIVDILIKCGADINKENRRKITPLQIAVQNRNEDIVKLLIQNGARIDPRMESGYYEAPLHQAVEDNEKSIVELLLKNGANIEVRDAIFNRSPIHYAADKNLTSILKILLENGANTEAEDRTQYTPIILAIHNGHNEAVEILLEHGAKLDHLTSDQITPIDCAIFFKRKHILKILLNTNPNLSRNCFASILHFAAFVGDLEITKLLIEYGVNIDSYDRAARGPPIHVAISQNKDNPIEMTKWLLTNGASSNIRCLDGITPIECVLNKDVAHKLDLIKVITFFEHSYGPSHKEIRIKEI